MEMKRRTNKNHRVPFFILVLFTMVPTMRGHIADFDKVWKRRGQEAKKAAGEAYHADPQQVAHEFNSHVHNSSWGMDMAGFNTTRRTLRRKYRGPCMATNPIDRCWRCRGDWHRNRKRLADCVLGFGRQTRGGKKGGIYVVRDSSDNDMVNPRAGTLRHAVIQPGPLWIVFAHSMVIRLSQELIVTSDKTIDGRGANVHISNGAGITLQFVKNVILHGLHIHDVLAGSGGLVRDSVDHYGIRGSSDGDGISVFGSSNIWIDHVSMSNCRDGLIDVIMGSTAVTISNCHFTHHNDVLLFGASDGYSGDQIMQITLAFNHFGKGLVQRMPRCRWGFFHVVNNDYTHWLMYAIGGSQRPTIISQGNRFIAPPSRDSKEVTKREYSPENVWKEWVWRSEEDLMMNGAFFVQSGRRGGLPFTRKEVMNAKPGKFASRLTRFAGALNCKPGNPC